MKKEIKKVVLQYGTKEYEMKGVAKDSIGSEEIIDDTVKIEDLDPNAKKSLQDAQELQELLDNEGNLSEEECQEMWQQAMHDARLNI